MPWHPTLPLGSSDIRLLPSTMRANFLYLEKALSAEHYFPGSWPGSGTTAGHHRRGFCKIVYSGPAASVDALSSPGTGALAWVTGQSRLRRYDGSDWVTFPLVHPVSGFMTGNLDFAGALMDGRDISVDGAKLDTMSASSNTSGASMTLAVSSTGTMTKPDTPSGVTYTDAQCTFVAVQKYLDGTIAQASTSVEVDGDWKTNQCAMVICIGVK